MTLPRTAFVPGETVPIAAEADNKSSREVKSSSVKLFQTITYHAQGRSEVGNNEIKEKLLTVTLVTATQYRAIWLQ